ncbi:siderophore-iron reductase FhuF [Pseudomonas sp. NPDC089734]|uniref:siderophore-iron reductase FhuF n=1 Tax=Pseudomonas sp. NPDC089734 TaxID=3364469 RepID=UPI00381C67A6
MSVLFTGPLEPFGQTLLTADDPRPVTTLAELLQPSRMDALLLGLYGPDLMPAHLPVLVSQWAKYYFMQVIPPLMAAGLVQEWYWPLHLDQVAVALDERGVPAGVKLLARGESLRERPVDPFQRFAGLLDDNLQPVIKLLSVYGHVSRGVLWGSAGDYLEACLTQLGRCSNVPLEKGWALLTHPQRPDGRRNPLFQAVSYVEQADGSAPRRQRRTCCLSHRVEWVGRCEHCPLPA